MSDELPSAGVLLGVDYGTVRIGFAKCDSLRIVVTPLSTVTITGKSLRTIASLIATTMQETGSVGIIFGWPDCCDSRTETVRAHITKLITYLRKDFSAACVCVEEDFSSREALSLLHEAGKKQKKKRILDQYAAAVILQRYLDEGNTSRQYNEIQQNETV